LQPILKVEEKVELVSISRARADPPTLADWLAGQVGKRTASSLSHKIKTGEIPHFAPRPDIPSINTKAAVMVSQRVTYRRRNGYVLTLMSSK
jgi:hypothetical protein